MGRVVFAKRAEPVDWLQIESRLQDISACSTSDVAIAPPRDLATDLPVTAPGEDVVSLSHDQDFPEVQAAIAVFDSITSHSATAFNRARAGSN